MKRILITGMSGTGKSSIITALRDRGYKAVDMDEPGWSELVPYDGPIEDSLEPGGELARDWVWREDRLQELLSTEDADVLFFSGTSSNQGKFYPQLDEVVLVTAPVAVIAERLATRTTNPYGKRPEELARVLHHIQTVEPLLRKRATLELDTSAPLEEVVASVVRLAGATDG